MHGKSKLFGPGGSLSKSTLYSIANTSKGRSRQRGFQSARAGRARQRMFDRKTKGEFHQHAASEPQHGKRHGPLQNPAGATRVRVARRRNRLSIECALI
jgi:hypothetical protein